MLTPAERELAQCLNGSSNSPVVLPSKQILFRNRAGGGVLTQKSNHLSCAALESRQVLNIVLSMSALSTPKHAKKQMSDGFMCVSSFDMHLLARLLTSAVICGPSVAPFMTATKRAAIVLRCCSVSVGLVQVKY